MCAATAPAIWKGGSLASITVIKQIRDAHEDGTLLINTGDTLQGSAEALFTRGQALIDVLNLFGYDADAPGNWDYLYGTDRFIETFAGKNGAPPLAPWSAVAANLYYDGAPYADKTGQRVLPPYVIRQVGTVKVGIIGFTTNRGLPVVGPKTTQGFKYTEGDAELAYFIDVLRNQEQVDLVVMTSELELANNKRLVEKYPGVDVVLSADMHERTIKPIIATTGTILVEEGQDGTMVGELNLEVENGKLKEWKWTPHIITDIIKEDKRIAKKVEEVRRPFLAETFVPGQTVTVAGNTATLLRPADEVVGYTAVDLHRSNFSYEDMPAVVEGSSHDFIADAMRWAAGSDFATIRGFRYGTHVPAGSPITMEDLYHYMPIGAKVGRAYPVYGKNLKTQIENSTRGTFDPSPLNWTGGWLFGYSGVTFDLDVYQPFGSKGSNIKINGQPIDPNDTKAKAYSVAGYWFADAPNTINNCSQCSGGGIDVLKDENGNALDVAEIVVRYLQLLPSHTANPQLHRINLLKPLPAPLYGFDVIQPLQGTAP